MHGVCDDREIDMRFIAAFAVAAWMLTGARPVSAETCDHLASIALPDTTITMAHVVNEGAFVPPAAARGGRGPSQNPFGSLQSFCRVAATLKPTSDSDIKV